METFQMSRPGAESDQLTQMDEEVLERITQRMRRKLIEQRILSKPSFQDFDKWVENASFSKEGHKIQFWYKLFNMNETRPLP